MPILVISGDGPSIVQMANLPEYMQNHPGASFRIPLDQRNQIAEGLRRTQPSENVARTFQVNDIGSDRQEITVSSVGSRVNIGRYIVTEGRIEPIECTMYGPLFGLIVVVGTLFACSPVLIIFLVLFRPRRDNAASASVSS